MSHLILPDSVSTEVDESLRTKNHKEMCQHKMQHCELYKNRKQDHPTYKFIERTVAPAERGPLLHFTPPLPITT